MLYSLPRRIRRFKKPISGRSSHALRIPIMGILLFMAILVPFHQVWGVKGLVPEEPADGAPPANDSTALNENTCTSTRCHPMLKEVPVTSRHGKIKCVTCHGQRRGHTEQCVKCHEMVRGHTESMSLNVSREQMLEVRQEDAASQNEFPEPVSCLTCHLKLEARPLTFPQIVLEEHVPESQSKKDCTECHRAHDPKPLMGHPMPMPYCRRGRDCCLSCHEKIQEITSEDRVSRPESTMTNPLVRRAAPPWLNDWADDTFMDWVLNPPLVLSTHGHGTVECISCHGAPPSFRELAKRVHNFELDTVRCGRCHTGSTIIDQFVARIQSFDLPGEPPMGGEQEQSH